MGVIEAMTYAEYFANRDKHIPPPKFESGARVFGRFSGVPFIGTVIREHEKHALIHADLPVKVNSKIHDIITVHTKGIKRLVEL